RTSLLTAPLFPYTTLFRSHRPVLRHPDHVGAALSRRQGEDHGGGEPRALKRTPRGATIVESGFPDFRSITWFGLVGPPNMPAALDRKSTRLNSSHGSISYA